MSAASLKKNLTMICLRKKILEAQFHNHAETLLYETHYPKSLLPTSTYLDIHKIQYRLDMPYSHTPYKRFDMLQYRHALKLENLFGMLLLI